MIPIQVCASVQTSVFEPCNFNSFYAVLTSINGKINNIITRDGLNLQFIHFGHASCLCTAILQHFISMVQHFDKKLPLLPKIRIAEKVTTEQ